MKTKIIRNSPPQVEKGEVSVRFEYSDPNGYLDPHSGLVCIAGTFNNWHPCATPLRATGTGLWIADLLLSPGTYEYLFVVEGHWKPDPKCHETVENNFGGINSVIHVSPARAVTHGIKKSAQKQKDFHEQTSGI